jgi:formate--tetrahydrofolate ligase
MHYSDIVITEAGFGADLGAQKFLDIKCRIANIAPSAIVIVSTLKALKSLGGAKKEDLAKANNEALKKGLPNLLKHIENIITVYKLPCVVALNKFESDEKQEIDLLKLECEKAGAKVVLTDVWALGGKGGLELAEEVEKLICKESKLEFSYDLNEPIDEKIRKIAVKIYGAKSVVLSSKSKKAIEKLKGTEFEKLPICIAKTQYSLSDNPSLMGRPQNFDINIRDILLRAGAGFLVALAGDIMLMPGLGRIPSAEKISIDDKEIIKGLF